MIKKSFVASSSNLFQEENTYLVSYESNINDFPVIIIDLRYYFK